MAGTGRAARGGLTRLSCDGTRCPRLRIDAARDVRCRNRDRTCRGTRRAVSLSARSGSSTKLHALSCGHHPSRGDPRCAAPPCPRRCCTRPRRRERDHCRRGASHREGRFGVLRGCATHRPDVLFGRSGSRSLDPRIGRRARCRAPDLRPALRLAAAGPPPGRAARSAAPCLIAPRSRHRSCDRAKTPATGRRANARSDLEF